MSASPRPSAGIALVTLGTVDLRHPERGSLRTVLAQPKRFALLAYLALATPRGRHQGDRLLGVFWPDVDEERARASLRSALHFLRRSLGETVICTSADAVSVDHGEIRCDAVMLDEALDAGSLEAAVHAYTGDLLAGFHLDDAPEWERWLDAERARLHARVADAAWTLATRAEAAGACATAAAWAQRALAFTPHEEAPLRRAMMLLAHCGDPSAALHLYDQFAARLGRDLDAEPSASTRALAASLRQRSAGVADPVGPAAVAAAPIVAKPTTVAPTEPVVRNVPLAPAVATEPPVVAPPPLSLTRPVTRSRLRRWTRVVALAAAVIAVGSGMFALTAPRADGEAADPTRVVVLPFVVHAGPDLAYLGSGMSDLLSARLDGAGELRAIDTRALPVPSGAIGDATSAADVGRDLARGVHAGLFVLGDVVREGSRVYLEAALYRVDGSAEPVARARVEGHPDELPTLVDGLAARLLADRLGGPAARLDRVAAGTTRSLPALKAYLLGRAAMRTGDFEGAREHFATALATDTSFALAAYEASLADDFVGSGRSGTSATPDGSTPATWAFRHAGALAPHERLLIAARYHAQAGRSEQASALYREVLADFPNDADAWYLLGDELFHRGPPRGTPFTAARPAFERAVALVPGHVHALAHLARIAAFEDRMDAVDSLTHRALSQQRVGDEAAEMLALRGIALGDTASLTAALAQLRAATEKRVWITAWRAATYGGDPARARPLLMLLTTPEHAPDMRATGHLALAHVEAAAGRLSVAARELDTADAYAPGSATIARLQIASMIRTSVPANALTIEARTAFVGPAALAAAADHPGARLWRDPAPTVVGSGFSSLAPVPGAFLRAAAAAISGDSARALREAASLARERRAPDPRSASPAELAREIDRLLGRTPVTDLLAAPPDLGSSLLGSAGKLVGIDALTRAGHPDAALDRLALFGTEFYYQLLYAAPVANRRAELLARAGRQAEARAARSRAARVWREADPEIRALLPSAPR